MELTTVWFSLIAVLWIGYFVLEGFDFGVGMLLPFVSRNDTERRVVINTIGPVWDGNEVWVLVAGGATFAAFPEWYATLFSGFYLPLLLILVALIVRGLAFEYRAKRDEASWKARWDMAIFVGSLLPAFLWGVAFANILRGVPVNADKEYVGGLFTLLNPYGLLGGLTTLGLFLTHGAIFLALKTARDWARYGQLWMDGGRCSDGAILSEEWIRFSTTPTPQSADGASGAHWWLKLNPEIGGGTPAAASIASDAFFAIGHEGQTLTVIPSRRLVIVRLGAAIYIDAWNQAEFVASIQDVV